VRFSKKKSLEKSKILPHLGWARSITLYARSITPPSPVHAWMMGGLHNQYDGELKIEMKKCQKWKQMMAIYRMRWEGKILELGKQ
jgi:hypothetical protein